MIAELIAAGTLITLAFGIVTVLINSRLGSFKSQIDELKENVAGLSQRLAIVENERDSAKQSLEDCREKRIEVLEENRGLRSIMSHCNTCKNAHQAIRHQPIAHHPA